MIGTLPGYGAIIWGALKLRTRLVRPKRHDLAFFTYRRDWNLHIARSFGFDLKGEGPRPHAGTLVVSNHAGFADIMALICESPADSMLNFVSKKEIGNIPIFGWHMDKYGDVLFDRANPDARKAVVSDSLARLKQGFSVVLFPEGTRSKDGSPKDEIRPALIDAAIREGIPIQPVGIAGTLHVIERPKLRKRGHKIRLYFGPTRTTFVSAAEVWTEVRRLWERAHDETR